MGFNFFILINTKDKYLKVNKMSRNNRRRYNKIKKSSKVIRCKNHNRPVLEHEVCSSFSKKDSANNQKNCENCTYSI